MKFQKKFRTPLVVFLHDLAIVPIAWFGAYWLRFNLEQIPAAYIDMALVWLPALLVIQSILFIYFGLYRADWRFASSPDLVRILKAVTVGVLISLALIFTLTRLQGMPRSVFPLYALLLLLGLAGPRFIYRWIKDNRLLTAEGMNVLIVGAGQAGEMLVRDMLRTPGQHILPGGFIDDKTSKLGREIHGVRVLGNSSQIPFVVDKHHVELILIAIPSANSKQMQRIVKYCELAGVPFRTLPRFTDMVSGRISLDVFREVAIEDLLGRESVILDRYQISQNIKGKRILVTGAGGSIGSGLVRELAQLEPESVILLEQSEHNLYQVEREIAERFPALSIKCFLGDVTDTVAVNIVFKKCQPELIFHAAAYKHVPMLEDQGRQAILNNIQGTKVLAAAADRHRCECFVLISTDKAVNPSSVMGATKRAAEILCQTIHRQSSTRFITVRFGNVLDSAGSVVPLFREQIKAGGPVTVTHPEMNRYFMTIPEACQLILQAGAMGEGGEIYVLDMGEPVKIAYLAEQMIHLSRKVPGEDIDIVFTGLRPGEKLFEELFHEQEQLVQTDHPKIFLAKHREEDWQQLNTMLDQIETACQSSDESELKVLLNKLVPEWQCNQVNNEIETERIVTETLQKSEDRPSLLH